VAPTLSVIQMAIQNEQFQNEQLELLEKPEADMRALQNDIEKTLLQNEQADLMSRLTICAGCTASAVGPLAGAFPGDLVCWQSRVSKGGLKADVRAQLQELERLLPNTRR
jgi:hypothetical protein